MTESDQPVTAADCYRFALAHPAVSVSLSAPASLDELRENLSVLHAPVLSEQDHQRLCRHGADVYAQDRRFEQLVRYR